MRIRNSSGWLITQCLLIACQLFWSAKSQAEVTGQWNFQNGDVTAAVGRDLDWFDGSGGSTQLATQFGTTATFGISSVEGQEVPVIRIPKNSSSMGLVMYPDMSANGGGVLVNQYSIVIDLLYPATSSGRNRALIQAEDPFVNLRPAALLVGTSNGVGVDGVFHGVISPETWHRLVVTVDLAATPPVMTRYIDGVLVGEQVLSQGIDGRWALNDRMFGFGSDAVLLFTDSAGASEVTYVSSIQVHERVLAPTYVAALGGVSSDKIPSTVTPRALVGRIQPQPGDPVVLPGTLFEVEIWEGAEPILLDEVNWQWNGTRLTPESTRLSDGRLVLRVDPGLLPPGSVHEMSLSFEDPSTGELVEADPWQFTMAPYNLPPMDPSVDAMLFLAFDETTADQGGEVIDGSPQSNHGVLRLEQETMDHKIEGIIGTALDFKADQFNYIELSKGWSGSPNSFSVWVRVSPEVPSGTRVGVILGNFSVANNINWEMHTQGRPRVYWDNGNPDWNVSGFDLRTGAWEHVAFVRNSVENKWFLYRNGRRVAVRDGVGANVLPVEPPFVGADRRGASSPYFRGALDDLVVYERALTDVEVWRLYARALDLPTYVFPEPEIVEVRPADGAIRQNRQPVLEVRIDEENSQTRVDRDTVRMVVQGQEVTPELVDEGGFLIARYEVTTPWEPGLEIAVEVKYFNETEVPVEVSRAWSFNTAPLPVITQEPEDRRVIAGANVSLSVGASTTPPVNYQWRKNGQELEGEINSTLVLTSVALEDSGEYDVRIRDEGGEVFSRQALIQVQDELPSDPAESLRIGLNAHWPFDEDFSSPVFGFEGVPRNGAEIVTEAKIGSGSVRFIQDQQQSVGVARRVIDDLSLVYTSAGWFQVTGGTGRRFLWETAPANWAISTEITAGETLRVFTRNANTTSRDLDTGLFPVPGAWHHVAVVFDAVLGEAQVYFDGVKVELPFPLEQGVGTGSTSGFNMGTYRAADGRFFDGYLDDVAVWDRALTSEEIAWLAAGNGVPPPLPPPLDPIVIVELSDDVEEWVGGQAVLSVVATGTEPLLYQWYQDGEPVPNATTSRFSLVLSDATVAGPYTVIVRDAEKILEGGPIVVTIRPLPEDPEMSLPAGLVAHWSFDEDFQSSSSAHNGVPINDPVIVSEARIGTGAVRFAQGSSQSVRVETPVIADATHVYAVAGWFRLEGGTGRRFLWETSPSHWAVSAEISAAGNLQIFTRQAIVNSLSINTGIAPEIGVWHHLAVNYDAGVGEVRVYVDGNRVDVPFPISAQVGTAPTAGFNMGTYRAADGRFFEGSLDEVGVWRRLLTVEEIQYLADGQPILRQEGTRVEFTTIQWVAEGLRLEWTGGQPPYRVQYRSTIDSGIWMDLGVPTEETSAVDANSGDETRFYRVLSGE